MSVKYLIFAIVTLLPGYFCNAAVDSPEYLTKYLLTKVDHFSNSNPTYFKLKYLFNDTFWKRGGPIFFYTGNEGTIELFCNNTGFVWELAPQFNAMVVFAEHRFYGDSIPFGADAFKKRDNYGYLTSTQALADFVELISYLKTSIPGAEQSSVIAFGGSYGGMLSAWLRIKYPNIIAGAIAASAPIWQFENITECGAFSAVTTKAYELTGGKECVDRIRNVWDALTDLSKTTSGRTFMKNNFRLCYQLTEKNASVVKDFVNELIIDAAMGNYPYPTEFLGKWPAWPVKEFCKSLVNGGKSNSDNLYYQHPRFRHAVFTPSPQALVEGIAQAVLTLANYSGELRCLDISEGSQAALGIAGWDIQTCNEMVMPMCSNGKQDMFEPIEWSLDRFLESCKQRYNLSADPRWIEKEYWGKRIQTATNIVFSNGLLDPWSSGGVMQTLAPTLPSIIIPSGAHHLDLRSSHPLDPPDVVLARAQEITWIQRWIQEWNIENIN